MNLVKLAAGCLLFVLTVAAYAQSMTAQFEYIELKKVGKMTGNYQSGNLLHKMSGGVELLFVARNREENLAVSASRIDFEYANKQATSPIRIVLEGDVKIVSQGNYITSDKADIDFESGIAVFTGDPHLDSDQIKNMRAERIVVNLETGDFDVSNGRIDKVIPDAKESSAE